MTGLVFFALLSLTGHRWSRMVHADDLTPDSPTITATWRGPVLADPTATPESSTVDQTPGVDDAAIVEPATVEPTLAGDGGDGTLRRIYVPILMYHYISTPPEDADIYRLDLSVTPENFRSQMQYLAENGYHVISLYDLNEALRWGEALPAKPVILTFDDGYVDAYTNAFPILQEFGFTGTFFVITDRLDEGHPDYLSWAQAEVMTAAGMSIESHTKAHPNLQERNLDYLVYQIWGSMESIAAHTGQQPQMFSYPSGSWDEDVLAALPSFDVWQAVITENGSAHTTDAPFLLRRVRVSGDTGLSGFAALLTWNWSRAES